MSLFKIKYYSKPKRVKTVYEGEKKQIKLEIPKQSGGKIIKNMRNLFGLKQENKGTKDITTVFEHQEEDYHKPLTENNFCNNNYIEYVSSGDRKKLITIRIP